MLLSWPNGEREEIGFHFGSFVVPTFWNDFPWVREGFGIVVLSPWLNSDFGHGREVVSVQGHRVGVMAFKRTGDNGVQAQDFFADTVEVGEFEQGWNGES